MPVRLPPVTEHASRVLLEGLVDYAGLFPPAALAMPSAVRNYAHYRAAGTGWMLGRFICPANALELFSQQADPLLPRDAGAIPWRLSVTASSDIAADLVAIAAFNERHRVCFEECGAIVDAYEVRVATAADIARIDAQLPRGLLVYCEVTPAVAPELVRHIAAAGRRAKLRAGGITTDAFPSAASIVTFLQACITHRVVAKATAGLHHPLCGAYRLTYDAAAPTGRMYGYLNVFLAAALLLQGGASGEAERLLEETSHAALHLDEFRVTWHGPERDVALDRALLQRVRDQLLVSFGSCSFTEPVDEIRAMGWL
jgi:hypothetical protein